MPREPKKADVRPELAARVEEERLVHALICRGLVTREEVKACSRASATAAAGAKGLLERLVAAGLLTANQAARARRDLEDLLGQQIPGYELFEKLGQGAMGRVYRARQLSMNRLVAIKILHPQLAADPKYLEKLTHEAHLAARLSHNNIVQAIDVGSAGPLHYFVMELVEGSTIREELDDGKVYQEREAVEIVLQIAQALQHASRRGLVHRDVKPANIMLTEEGVAKLADLGMARDTSNLAHVERERGLLIGTPYYIAPEQIRGRTNIDTRADIYALGATLYHMVTGQPPFPSKDVHEVLHAHLEGELVPPDHINQALSGGLGEVVEVMMARDRRRRYRSPDDLILDLTCLLNNEPPRIARQGIDPSMLEDLTGGETEAEAETETEAHAPMHLLVWVGVLAGLLALSVLLNIVLLLRHH